MDMLQNEKNVIQIRESFLVILDVLNDKPVLLLEVKKHVLVNLKSSKKLSQIYHQMKIEKLIDKNYSKKTLYSVTESFFYLNNSSK